MVAFHGKAEFARLEDSIHHSNIANERLRMDYQRLAGAGIALSAKYF